VTNKGDGSSIRAERIELIFTMILAIAAVGTAWAGFQSAKWSGVQANSYATAGAARTESSRASTEAGILRTVDVISFTEWLTALNQEILADPSSRPEGAYEPVEGTVSGFLYTRFRDEFKPAVEAWIALRPLITPDAPPTPFAMPEYQIEAESRAQELVEDAERLGDQARDANQTSDNYVLLGVLFALTLFFVALGLKSVGARSRYLLLGLSSVTLISGLAIMATFPVEI
jgi:hypothetical protein